MKNKLISIICMLLIAALAAGCGAGGGKEASGDGQDSLKIVTTIFPLYDWVREILGAEAENAELTMLLDSGVDLHSYQPTVDDIIRIASADLFIYVGGASDKWVADALAESTNPNLKAINLLEVLGDAAKEEELVEGMEAEDEEEEEGEEPEYDEHVWLSLRNAQTLCGVIAQVLCEIDPEHADSYAANASSYEERLAALDEEYKTTTEEAPRHTILFGDRFAFRYMMDDYGLDYYAAFVGCSAETEASFETIVFLAGKVDELGLRAILQQESSDGSIARTIRDNTEAQDQEILTMNSLQGVTAQDAAEGVTYLSVMLVNLAVLRQALYD